MKRRLLDRAFEDMRAARRYETAVGYILKRRYLKQAFSDQIQEHAPLELKRQKRSKVDEERELSIDEEPEGSHENTVSNTY